MTSRIPQVLTIGAEAPVLVAAAGGADLMVGRASEYGSPLGRYQSELQDVPELTTGQDDLATEAIIGADPDLAITRDSEDAAPLEVAGIDRIVISGRCSGADDEVTAAGTFEEVYSDVALYWRIFGTEDTAATAITDLRARADNVGETAEETRAELTADPRLADVGAIGGGDVIVFRSHSASSPIPVLGLEMLAEQLDVG
jgi:iron complex transport system substrate-binding protein